MDFRVACSERQRKKPAEKVKTAVQAHLLRRSPTPVSAICKDSARVGFKTKRPIAVVGFFPTPTQALVGAF